MKKSAKIVQKTWFSHAKNTVPCRRLTWS